MKKILVICFFLIVLVFISFVSAGFFGDLWSRVTGRAVSCSSDFDCPDEVSYYCQGDYVMEYEKTFSCVSGSCKLTGGTSTPHQKCEQGCENNECVGEEEECFPKTCSEFGFECGKHDNGCGVTINCGECEVGECVDGVCVGGEREVGGEEEGTAEQGTGIGQTQESEGEQTQEEIPEFQGFIIELEDDPLLFQKKFLEEEAEKNKGSVLANVGAKFLPRGIAPAVSENVDEKVERAKENLERDKQNFKSRALRSLGKSQIVTGNAVSESGNELKVLGEYELVYNGMALDITEEEAEEIKKLRGVKGVYPNYKVEAFLDESVPQISADAVWLLDEDGNNCAKTGKECLTGEGVTIGIIDTGVDYTNPYFGRCTKEEFLSGNCDKVVGGYDFVNDDPNPMDDHNHGTHCAGIAAGNGVIALTVKRGVAPDAQIYSYKVLGPGGGTGSAVILAIERSMDPNRDGDFSDHLDVISLSLGMDCKMIREMPIYYPIYYDWLPICTPEDPQSKAIDNAVDAGVVAVIAAGNSGPGQKTIASPGTSRRAITVGAVDKDGDLAGFSSRGPVVWVGKEIIKPDIVAPGVSIVSAVASGEGTYESSFSGTSMATPHVAGAVALVKQAHPDWTPKMIKDALKITASELGYDENGRGTGEIDILDAINLKNYCEDWGLNYCGDDGNLYHKKICYKFSCDDTNNCEEFSEEEVEIIRECSKGCSPFEEGDDQCISIPDCKQDGESCSDALDCCSLQCTANICGGCRERGESCMSTEDCCNANDRCYALPFQENKCWGCIEDGEECRMNGNCCGEECIQGTCGKQELGETCEEDDDCEEGLVCFGDLIKRCADEEDQCVPPEMDCTVSEDCCLYPNRRCYSAGFQQNKCWRCKDEGTLCRSNDECCSGKCEFVLDWLRTGNRCV